MALKRVYSVSKQIPSHHVSAVDAVIAHAPKGYCGIYRQNVLPALLLSDLKSCLSATANIP